MKPRQPWRAGKKERECTVRSYLGRDGLVRTTYVLIARGLNYRNLTLMLSDGHPERVSLEAQKLRSILRFVRDKSEIYGSLRSKLSRDW